MKNYDPIKHIITVKDDDVLHPYDPNEFVGYLNDTMAFVPTKDSDGNYTLVGKYCKNVILTNTTADEYNEFILYQNVSLDVGLIKKLKRALQPVRFIDCKEWTKIFNRDVLPKAQTNPQEYLKALEEYTTKLKDAVKTVMETNVQTALDHGIEIEDEETKRLATRLKNRNKNPENSRTK